MVETVIWSKRAERLYMEMLEYLATEASYQAAENLDKTVRKTVEGLKRNPGSGRPTLKSKTVRYLNISKYKQIFYRQSGKTLHIVAFFDVRQHPQKRPF
jgi:plasmid stabilization system protein ParE